MKSKRKDLLKAVKNSNLPVRSLKEIYDEVNSLCGGKPAKPKIDKNKVVAAIKWVDGTILDSVYQVKK